MDTYSSASCEIGIPENGRDIYENNVFPDPRCNSLLLEVGLAGVNTYYFSYRDRLGLHRHKRLGDSSKLSLGEARRLAGQLELKRSLDEDLFPEEKTQENHILFNVFVDRHYLPFVKSYKRSWSADVSYLTNHHLPYFGDLMLHEINREHVAKFRQSMLDRSYAAGTVNRCLVLLRYLFNLAIKWEMGGIEKNPTKDVPLVRDTKQMERFLSVEETERLYRAISLSENPYLKHIVPLLLMTGARKREILDARWENILWDRRLLMVPLPKGGKPRYIPLSKPVIEILDRVRLEQKDLFDKGLRDHGWVFPNPKTGNPFVSIFNAWQNARLRAGLEDLRLHDLRHSFASFLVNNGRTLYEVQRILGHTQIRTTQRYAHLSQDTLLEAVDMAAELLDTRAPIPDTNAKDKKITRKSHKDREVKVQKISIPEEYPHDQDPDRER